MAARKPMKAKTDKRRRARIQTGIDGLGQPIYKWVSAASDAELAAAKQDARQRYSGQRNLDRVTLGAYVQAWYKMKSATLSKASDNGYRSQLNACILPRLGGRYIRSITTEELFDLLRDEAAQGKSASHVRKVRMILRQIFRYALDDGTVERDPTRLLPLPDCAPAVPRRALTADETAATLAVGQVHEHGLLLLVLYYLGLRRGEALGLMWSDIDWAHGTIHIQRDVDFAQPAGQRLGQLKTDAADRVLPIPDELFAVLRARRGIGLLTHAATSDAPLSESTYKRIWASLGRAIAQQAQGRIELDHNGLPVFTPHYLRHNYATVLYHAGVDVLQAQKWLGHTDVKITLAVYSHLADEDAARNAQKLLGNAFGNGNHLAMSPRYL